MKLQVLAPTVQDRKETNLGPEMFGSAAMVLNVSAVIRKRMPRTSSLFW